MARKIVRAIVAFPVYIQLHPREIEGLDKEGIKERVIELAEQVIEEELSDMKGFIVQCTRRSIMKPLPKLKKGGFKYSADTATELTDSNSDTDDDDDTDLSKFGFEDTGYGFRTHNRVKLT